MARRPTALIPGGVGMFTPKQICDTSAPACMLDQRDVPLVPLFLPRPLDALSFCQSLRGGAGAGGRCLGLG